MPDEVWNPDEDFDPPGESAGSRTGKYFPAPLDPTGKFKPVAAAPTGSEQSSSGVKLPPALTSGPPAIPGYDVVGELGRGGMGVVFKAWHIESKRFVALKMVLSVAQTNETNIRRFRAEAEAVARLSHPHIVQIFEIGEHRGWPFFSLEFCGGGSLAKKLANHPLSAHAAATLMEKLARGVAVAHQQQIIHRDLKPANILLTSKGEPKISDFGLAKQLDQTDQPSRLGSIMGTPSYMPPEQADAAAHLVGPQADIYSLGAILYECLTGRPPFKGATALNTLEQVRTQEPIPPRLFDAKIPADLEEICLKCLQKKPDHRYVSADALAEDLRRFLNGKPVSAARGNFHRWAKARPGWAGFFAGILLASVFAALLALFLLR